MSFSEFLDKRRGAVKPIASVCCSLAVAALCGCSADTVRFEEWGWSNGASYRGRDKGLETGLASQAGRRSQAPLPQEQNPADVPETTQAFSYGGAFTMAEGDAHEGEARKKSGRAKEAAARGSGDDRAVDDRKAKPAKPKRRARRKGEAHAAAGGSGGYGPGPAGAGDGYDGAGFAPPYGYAPVNGAPYAAGGYQPGGYAAPYAYQGAPYGPPPGGYYGGYGVDRPTGASGRTHVVGRGDTLYGISRRYGVNIGELTAMNQLTGATLSIGQTLLIPESEASAGPAYGGQRYNEQPYNGQGYPGRPGAGQPNANGGPGYGAPGYEGGYGEQSYGSGSRGYAAQERDGGYDRPRQQRYGQQPYEGGQGQPWQGYQGQGRRGHEPHQHGRPDQAYGDPAPGGRGYAGQGAGGYGDRGYDSGYARRDRRDAESGRDDAGHPQQNHREYDPRRNGNYRDNRAPGREGALWDRDNGGRPLAGENRPIAYREAAAASRLRRPERVAAAPAEERGDADRPGADRDSRERPGSGSAYTVKRGDTLHMISRRHGLTSERLAEHNGLDPHHRLRIGQELRIPETRPAAMRSRAAASEEAETTDDHEGRRAPRGARTAPPAEEAPVSDAPVPAHGAGGDEQAAEGPVRPVASAPAGSAPTAQELAAGGGEAAKTAGSGERDAAAASGEGAAPSSGQQEEPAPKTAVLTGDRPRRHHHQPPQQQPAAERAPAKPGLAPAPQAVASAQPAAAPTVTTEAIPSENAAVEAKDCEALLERPMARSSEKFREPVQGRIVAGFGASKDGTHNDGVNFMVPSGTVVKAAENGVVAYAGNELSGFGNLILIRHAEGYVTAYAHNEKLLVRRCDVVRRGQAIARSGATGAVPRPQLHFEIRKDSKPIDPTQLIARL